MKREIKFRACSEGVMTEPFYLGSVLCHSYRGHLMQYTGLKDKNSKEIYEGDVILNPNATHPEDKGFYIVYVGFRFAAYNVRYPNQDYYGMELSSLISEHFEVIGNIHENQELLTTQSVGR